MQIFEANTSAIQPKIRHDNTNSDSTRASCANAISVSSTTTELSRSWSAPTRGVASAHMGTSASTPKRS